MDLIKQLLLLSEKLYTFLETRPENKEEKRDEYIAYVTQLLNARGQTIEKIKQQSIVIKGHEYEPQLKVLDKGIIERLHKFKAEIRQDMNNVQKSRESEKRYQDPYSAVSVMDGTYYDKRK